MQGRYTKETLDHLFTYHAPTPEQQERLVKLRQAARTFADVLVESTIPCLDQTAALRLLRECVMTANASIVLDGVS